MLFNEIYSRYFQVVASILSQAADGCLTQRRLTELVREKAFAESVFTIPTALTKGEWPLLTKDLAPVLSHKPSMPLTTLEKRWMKALMQDPRIALFAPDTSGLEDVTPLYAPDTFVFFDRYADGDPYQDENYIVNFRTILQAIHEKRALRIRFRDQMGIGHSPVCIPYRLEYSAKDDKFRLLALGKRSRRMINLARIKSCMLLDAVDVQGIRLPREHLCELTMHLHDERNALERALLHFSHLEKETRRLDRDLYEIKLRYDRDDETEILIRVLSFGPMLEVMEPAGFVELIRERLGRQEQYAVSPDV